jgi:hypothetical protein
LNNILPDHAVGLDLLKAVGDHVEVGETWAIIHHNTPIKPHILEMAR